MADLLAVIDHVGVERCFLSAAGFDAQATIAFAAEHPDRVAGVIAMATTPKLVRSDDHPSGVDPRLIEAWRASLDAPSTGNALDLFDVMVPSLRADDRARAWFAQAGRHSASPSTARAYLDVAVTMDVRPQLPQIAAPMLVLHNRDDGFIDVENARLMAALAPNGELAEFEGDDHAIFTGDYEAKVERVERFVTGTAGRTRRRRAALSWESMTPAERRVADLVAEGLTNPEIAARLSINRETVKTQVSAALRKTGARTRAELAAKLTAHLVDRPSVDHPDGG